MKSCVAAQVLVVGSANADLVLLVDRRPEPGETVTGSDVNVVPGGKGANQAAAAARAGAAVTFVGAVGHDPHGAMICDALARAGVEPLELVTTDRPTGQASILLTPDGENSIVVSPGANADLTPAAVDAIWPRLAPASVVVLNLEIPMDTVTHVVERALVSGARVVLNAAPAHSISTHLLESSDPLVVNETEAAVLLDRSSNMLDGVDAAMALVRLGGRSVVVTLGARGLVVADPTGSTTLGGFAVPVIDTTGAGDGFIGGLAARLCQGASLRDAASYASALAALSVGRLGAQTSYPSHHEVLELLGASGRPLTWRHAGDRPRTHPSSGQT